MPKSYFYLWLSTIRDRRPQLPSSSSIWRRTSLSCLNEYARIIPKSAENRWILRDTRGVVLVRQHGNYGLEAVRQLGTQALKLMHGSRSIDWLICSFVYLMATKRNFVIHKGETQIKNKINCLISIVEEQSTVWVKKSPPEIFWHFFPKGSEFLVQILHAYWMFLSTQDYKFLLNYLQLWRSYATLSATMPLCAQNIHHRPKRTLGGHT